MSVSQTTASPLSHFFSLTQMRTLHLHEFRPEDGEGSSFRRLPDGLPPRLDRMTITLRPPYKRLPSVESILASVVPRMLEIRAYSSANGDQHPDLPDDLPFLSLDELRCDRLQTLHLENAGVLTLLSNLAVSNLHLVIRATARLGQRAWRRLVTFITLDLALPNRLARAGDGDFPCRGMTVQIWVNTEERKQDLLEEVRSRATDQLDPTTLKDRMSRIHVEVEK